MMLLKIDKSIINIIHINYYIIVIIQLLIILININITANSILYINNKIISTNCNVYKWKFLQSIDLICNDNKLLIIADTK